MCVQRCDWNTSPTAMIGLIDFNATKLSIQKQEKIELFLVFQDMQMLCNMDFIDGEMWSNADVLLCCSFWPTRV